jgi:hypothetical protein
LQDQTKHILPTAKEQLSVQNYLVTIAKQYCWGNSKFTCQIKPEKICFQAYDFPCKQKASQGLFNKDPTV